MEQFRLGQSPFLSNPERPQVEVAGGNGPYANVRDLLSRFDLSAADGKRILIKPNAGRLAPVESGVNTHPQAVAAVIDAFREAGADTSVGESPISGIKTLEAFEASGIADVCRERNCPLIDMDVRPAVPVALPEGIAIDRLQLCPEIMEFDLIVSVPVMKMHMHTGVTLSIKNMKGCLWRRSKVKLHMLPPVAEFPNEKSINVAIADMAWALKPHFAVIDGSFGMEGLGPSAGAAKACDMAVASAEAFAADAVACALMGSSAVDIPHLRLAAERGYGIIDLNQIDLRPADWMNFSANFAKPPANLDFEFPGVSVKDKNSCSACQSTLLLFLKRYRRALFDYFPEEQINIVIGKGNEDVPEGALCLGNCAFKHRDKGIFVPGCPPVSSEILTALTGWPEYDTYDGNSEAEEE